MNIYRIRSKTVSRIAAVQVIYQYSQKKQTESIDSLLKKTIAFYRSGNLESHFEVDDNILIKAKVNVDYLGRLIDSMLTNLTLIDDLISKNLNTGRQISDMSLLLVAILRSSVCELTFFPETPKKVVINEFTDIAGDMLTDNETGFVNSILDNIAKETQVI
ncbi:MAG: transcription antitermination factor NusB [Rickettsiaceae bacterium]|nr:MAG: transcription antitermination factor NusB [Rickettsiaceae bacterium]